MSLLFSPTGKYNKTNTLFQVFKGPIASSQKPKCQSKKRNSENSFDKRLTCSTLFAMINLKSRSTFGDYGLGNACLRRKARKVEAKCRQNEQAIYNRESTTSS